MILQRAGLCYNACMKILLCDDEGDLLDEHAIDFDAREIRARFIKDHIHELSEGYVLWLFDDHAQGRLSKPNTSFTVQDLD